MMCLVLFVKQKTAYEMRISDWSSDVCSSDLRTGGQHGTDAMYAKSQVAEALGEAMGIVFQAPGSKTVYVVGDTIWRSEVDQNITRFKPDLIERKTVVRGKSVSVLVDLGGRRVHKKKN